MFGFICENVLFFRIKTFKFKYWYRKKNLPYVNVIHIFYVSFSVKKCLLNQQQTDIG